MTAPPKDIDPSDLWAQLATAPRPHEIVDYPRFREDGAPIGQVGIVVLTFEEQLACSRDAGKFTRSFLKEKDLAPEAPDYVEIYRSQAALEVLIRCCRKPNNIDHRMFPSLEELRRKATGDEIDVLLRQYLQVKAKYGPIISQMEEDQVDVWVERLAKAGSSLPLGLFSWDALAELTLRLAFRQHRFSTDTSSAGGPLDDGSNSTSSSDSASL